jgi:hypothetical protein
LSWEERNALAGENKLIRNVKHHILMPIATVVYCICFSLLLLAALAVKSRFQLSFFEQILSS